MLVLTLVVVVWKVGILILSIVIDPQNASINNITLQPEEWCLLAAYKLTKENFSYLYILLIIFSKNLTL